MSGLWATLAAGRVRNGPSSGGDVLGEVSKGDFVKVLVQEGDWIKLENCWEDAGDAWLMMQIGESPDLSSRVQASHCVFHTLIPTSQRFD